MYIERSNILKKYAEETKDEGSLYYIYSKNSSKENTYNVSVYDDEEKRSIQIAEHDLPKGAGVDSVLRMNNRKICTR